VLADSLYSGYLDSHKATIARLYQHYALRIPRQMTFKEISGLSNEVVERLDRAQPQTFGEARLLPGLTPGALSTLLVYLSAQQQEKTV
jgi:tRNA uridine 5-carboxymethylaminomethyl modification enzyme